MNRKNGEEKVKLSRIARIDAEIHSGKHPNAEKLAAELEVSPRTILRDIEYLKYTYDAPIAYDFYKRGFYYTEPTFFIRSVMLSKEELETITLFDKYIKIASNKNDDYSLKFRKIIDKLLMVLPEDKTNSLPFSPNSENDPDCTFKPHIPVDRNIEISLWEAVEKNEIVEIEYCFSDDEKIEKLEIEPLAIDLTRFDCFFIEDPEHHILAWKRGNRDKLEVFVLNKIRKVKNTGKHYKLPADFDYSNLPKYFFMQDAIITPSAYKLYNFEFSFPKEVASEAIKKDYYVNQHIELREDGTVYVSFKSTQIHEIFNWVLGQGRKVKVLNPPELVNMIKREAQRVVQYYI
jgi:proteasome accessory factor B